MGNKQKAKGTAFETQVLKYLRDQGFGNTYRPATKGAYDTGDINGITRVIPSNTPPIYQHHAIIQCKNHKSHDLSGWLNATVEQASQAEVGGNALPILTVKRRGVGDKNMGDTYAVLRLEDLVSLMKVAGYR